MYTTTPGHNAKIYASVKSLIGNVKDGMEGEKSEAG
jgi:hypothetical protein